MNDPVRQAAVKLLRFVPDDFPDIVAASLGHEAAEDAADAMHALRAALDAPPLGVTELEINQALNAGWTQGAADPVFWHKPAVAALLPLLDRARREGFAEGQASEAERCADECETERHRADHQKKHADLDGHTSEQHHQEGRWHLANDLEDRFRARAASIRSLAPPDDGLVVGRLRWVEKKTDGLWRAYVGELLIGTVFENHDGTGSWAVMHNADIRRADTPEAARAALVAAVRRAVEGGGDEL